MSYVVTIEISNQLFWITILFQLISNNKGMVADITSSKILRKSNLP